MPRRIVSAVAVLLLAAFAAAAQARTLVVLRNGFSIECDRTEPLDGTHMRLYLTPASSNYQDIATSEIARTEPLADLPPVASLPVISPAVIALTPQADPHADPTPAELHQLLSADGREHNLDADLLAAVVKAESAGHAHAVSRTGARGLMQLMPGTAAQLGVQDAFAAADNLRGGTAYLDALLKQYRDNLALALAAYNAGPQAVAKYHGVPPFHETRAYVASVIREFNRRKLAELHAGASVSALAAAVAH